VSADIPGAAEGKQEEGRTFNEGNMPRAENGLGVGGFMGRKMFYL
jgi:hypothetical protein